MSELQHSASPRGFGETPEKIARGQLPGVLRELSPHRPLERSQLANRNARKTPAGNRRGRKTASAPALGEEGTSPFAPFVQEGSLVTTISRGRLSGTNARGTHMKGLCTDTNSPGSESERE